MKNQYFGDIGDFGKYGMLSALLDTGLLLGINWYLTENDARTDGRHLAYLDQDEYRVCDPELHQFLNSCVRNETRYVAKLADFPRFQTAKTYAKIFGLEHIPALDEQGRAERIKYRENWFAESLAALAGSNIVFCDPDNGLETRSGNPFAKDGVKYTRVEEVEHTLETGMSVVLYQHRDRSSDTAYAARFTEVRDKMHIPEIALRMLRFRRYSVRDYLFFMLPRHRPQIETAINGLLRHSGWRLHFEEYRPTGVR